MLKLLFKYVLPLAVLLIGGLLTYNYFFGTDEERQQTERILGKLKDLGGEVVDLLRSEKQKYDEGKFDEALAAINERIKVLKDMVRSSGEQQQQWSHAIDDLEAKKQDLQNQLRQFQAGLNAGTQSEDTASSPNSFSQSNQPSGSSRSPATESVIENLGAQIEQLARQADQLTSQIKTAQ